MKLLHKLLIVVLVGLVTLTFAKPVQAEVTLEPLIRNDSTVKHFWSTEDVMIPTTYNEKDTEFRGVWVATVYNLNIPQYTSETQYKEAFLNLVSELVESHANAMLFQVRPLNDAFYDSAYAPWSRYVTGTEGVDPGIDLMAWMIETCHANGIEFHAWLNPYRVANITEAQSTYIDSLSSENFAKIHPEYVIYGNVDSHGRTPLILNPGEPAVKQYILNVVNEIMTLYDVDGIHFDDYFYPYSGMGNVDDTTYNDYHLVGQSLEDWRRENVNDVVRGVKEAVDTYNTNNGTSIRFGISPFGLWGSGIEGYTQTLVGGSNTGPTNLSSYLTQYADSKRWVEEGWVHYICPQVYWNFTHTTAPYADVVDWWASIARGTGVDVFIGHAPSSASTYSWPTEEISDQLRYDQQHPEIKGEVMYSAAYLDYAHMQYVEANNWTVTPTNAWDNNNPNISITILGDMVNNIYTEDVSVELASTLTVMYQLDSDPWVEYTAPFAVTGSGAHVLYLKTVDGLGTESSISSKNIPIQYINSDVPNISIVGSKTGDNYVPGSQITIDATNDIYVAINHGSVGEFQLYTGPITVTETGKYYVHAKTIDINGTESSESNLTFYIEEPCFDPPVIAITGEGNDPYFQSAEVSFTTSTTVEYKIDDGAYQTYTTPFTLSDQGTYTITYRNNDACLTEYTKDITIDTTAPSIPTMEITGDYDGERYYTSITDIALSGDLDSTIYYRVHNGTSWSSWKAYSSSIELLYSSNWTVEYYAQDAANNVSETSSSLLRLKLPQNEDNVYVIRNGEIVTYYNSDVPIELPLYTEKTEEIRAVWVATVSNIDVPLYDNETQYKNAIDHMLDVIESHNFNTIFFQVRPMNDAFYDSSYAPWSRYVTGTEGNDPGWDILQYIIDGCHERGIEFHAWLNPYRVSTSTDPKADQLAGLSDENWAKQHPDMVIADNDGKLILNPGERQVQAYIKNVIQELIGKYDVDGIHFDDYFYSYNGTPLSADEDLYNLYKEDGQTLDDWRRENINTIVKDVHDIIVSYNTTNSTTIEFGISPFGIWQSGGTEGSNTSPTTFQSYSGQYADSKKWVEEQWVDYILPQLYWQFDHSSAPFADLVDWWANLTEANNVDLIIGQGFFHYDDDIWDDEDELLEQLRYMSQYDSIIGSSFFSYKVLNSTDTKVVNALERLDNSYWTDYVTFPWPSTVTKTEDVVCDPGYHEENGTCVQDPVTCDPGYHEENGSCVVDPVTCDPGYHEENGSCVLDVDNTCPTGYEPIEGGCQLIEDEPNNTWIIYTVSGGVTVIVGGVLFIFRKAIFKI